MGELVAVDLRKGTEVWKRGSRPPRGSNWGKKETGGVSAGQPNMAIVS